MVDGRPSSPRPSFGQNRPQWPRPGGVRPPGQFQWPRPGSAPTGGTGVRPAMAPRPAAWPRPQWNQPRQVFTNEMIKAPRIVIVDEEGVNLGTFARDDALRMASEQWLDLVQIAYNPVEMVCTAKMVDYGKYMYNKQKEEKDKKKTQKSKGMKEIKFGYTIGDNDLQLKIKKSLEFLDDGYSVRYAVRLKGREKIYASKVVEKLHHIEETLKDQSRSQWVKEENNGYSMVLFPKGK